MNRLQRRNRRRRILKTVTLFILAGLIIYAIINSQYRISELNQNKIIVNGIIKGTTTNQRNTGGGVEYIFNVDGKNYSGSTAYPELSPDVCESLKGKSFPVIFDKNRVGNNEMLITSPKFKRYELRQPDSLRWIEKFIR